MAENQSFLLQDFNQQNAPARFWVKCVILMKLNLKLCFWGQGMAYMRFRLLPFLVHKQLSMEILMIPG